MGRQGGDPTVVTSSSIALLQERFRQLQKVRENREKKELLKLLSTESEHTVVATPYRRLSFQPDMGHQSDDISPDSLSLGLNSPATHAVFQPTTIPTSSCFWPDGPSTSRNQEISDVDTSLHL